MSRNKTNTVEYFPHVAKSGKTIFILEGQFGNDGYAFWFKLLELLASSEDHFYDASSDTGWHYLVARSKITGDSATEMLSLLAKLGNIDAELWNNHKIIWCQALIDNLSEVYRKRKRDLPNKPKLDNCDRKDDNCDRNAGVQGQSATESTQSRVEESRVKKSKEDTPLTPLSRKRPPKKPETPMPENFGISEKVKVWALKHGFDRLDEHLEAFKRKVAMKGYTWVDWDAAFMEAIREDWAKLRNQRGSPGPALAPGRTYDRQCPACGGSHFRKAKSGEAAVNGVVRCECSLAEKEKVANQ